ncbi:hypothetical protein QFC21_001914 [Naganishia friedmannii]|uniref:Uncharacterized protein n=1 Tax=Naganishia friedmannii TaxID=89922 RepID=A0ACC2VZD8_9TREE|nr:hypothetical protein QFC21_001914 [Naganishia friedmannii]
MTLSLRQDQTSPEAPAGPSLQQAREQSKATWARDLQGIYEHAKERFADVKWVADVDNDPLDREEAEILKDDAGAMPVDTVDALLATVPEGYLNDVDAIFGHKAIIYARAPKAFKDRYFSNSATGISGDQQYGGSTAPGRHTATSASTPNLHHQSQAPGAARSINSFASLPKAKSWTDDDVTNALNRPSTCGRGVSTLSHHGTPEMLKQALEWLYTAKVPTDQDTPALELIITNPSEVLMHSITENDSDRPNVGLISAKGVNGVDMVGVKTFKMGQLRLAQDLTYMWRSKLYTDIRIRICSGSNRQNTPTDRLARGPPSAFKTPLQGLRRHTSFSSVQVSNHSRSSTRNGNPEYDMDDVAIEGDEETVFSAHRFILCSRSPYFHQVLLNSGAFQSHPAAIIRNDSVDPDDMPAITLSSPPFTPMATYFTLGYLYSGSLSFSNKTFDLPTAFSITKAAMFLEVDSLVTELHAIIRDDLCHGMRYPVFWNGKKMGGCVCKKCVKRIPKVLRFAQAPDVQASELKRVAFEYLTQGWAECWSKDLASLDEDVQDGLLDKICLEITANGLVAMYSKLAIAEAKMEAERGEWVEVLQEMLDVLRTTTRQKLVVKFQDVAADTAFIDLLTDNGMDRALRDVILRDLTETLSKVDFCHHAARIYQILVGKLLKGTMGPGHRALSPHESSGRQAIDETKNRVLAVIKRRWLQMRPLAAFDGLEDWVLEEISRDLQVPAQELLRPETPEIRKSTIQVKATPAVPKPRVPVQSLSQTPSVPVRGSRTPSKTSHPNESLQRRGASGVSIPRTLSQASSAIPHRQPQTHAAEPTIGSITLSRNSVPSSSSKLSTPIRRAPASSAINTGSSATLPRPTRRQDGKMRSHTGEASVTPLPKKGVIEQLVPEGGDSEPSTSTPLRSASSPAARAVNPLPGSYLTIGHNGAPRTLSKMPVPSRLGSGSTRTARQAETTGRVAGAVARLTANASKPLATPKSASPSVSSLRNAASSAFLRAREKTMNGSDSSPIRPESTSLRLPKQITINTSILSKTLVLSSNKDSTHLPARRATGKLAASRSANIQAQPKARSPIIRKPITSSSSRSTGLDSSLQTAQSTRVVPSIEDGIIPTAEDSGSTTLGTDVPENTTCPNNSPRNDSVDKPSGRELPLKALRPLRLVEKRNSIVNGLEEYAAAIGKSSSFAAIPTLTSEHSLDMALSGVTSSVPQSVLSSLTDIETSTNRAFCDSSSAKEKLRTSKYGSTLSVISGIEQQPPQPKEANFWRDTRTSSLSGKYHPASAFDPPSRIPSISVAAEEEEDDCIPYDTSKGVTLTIGIPCVISLNSSTTNSKTRHNSFGSSRSRLRAICRYIGLVDGMLGEWVGVEVSPASLDRIKDLLDGEGGRVSLAIGPHDGSWNDIRYYRIRDHLSSRLHSAGRSASRPVSPLDQVGSRTWERSTLMHHQPYHSGNEAVALGASSPISLSNRLRSSPGGTSSSSILFPQDLSTSMLLDRNSESSWIAIDAAGVKPGTKCGLWVRPADVVFIPGAHD